MTVTTAEARARIVSDLGTAVDELALATACLGAAFEQLDDMSAERLEDELYRSAQKGLGRAKRTSVQFAERFSLAAPAFPGTAIPGSPNQGVKSFVGRAVDAVAAADRALAGLQDSMAPIEAGDPELRAGISEARELIDPIPGRAREFLRGLGR